FSLCSVHVYFLFCSCFRIFFSYSSFLFFFSSRRRHTRSKRDWSSDVCSSDLAQPHSGPAGRSPRTCGRTSLCGCACGCWRRPTRSEERRVGKEGGSRGWMYHLNKEVRRITFLYVKTLDLHKRIINYVSAIYEL